MSSDAAPTLAELVSAAIASRVDQIEVSMPGVVVDYDPATQTATIQPGNRRPIYSVDGERAEETIPPIANVPVRFDRSSKFSVHYRLVKGDGVQLVFSTRSMCEWRQLSLPGIATPGDMRPHSVSYPVAYPGLYPDAVPGPDHDESIGIPGSGSSRFHFNPTNIAAGGGADFVALAAKVEALFAGIKAAGASGSAATPVDPGAIAFFTALATALGTINVKSANLKAD